MRKRTMNPVHGADCAVAACAELIGSKWTAVILHDLSEGPAASPSSSTPARASAHARSPTGSAPSSTTDIVDRRSYHELPPRVEYELTGQGRALLPIVREMRRFGRGWLVPGKAHHAHEPMAIPDA